MALELEELEDGDAFGGSEGAGGVGCEEAVEVVGGAIEDDVDVGVASRPEIFEQWLGNGLGEGCGAVAEEIEGFAKGRAPAADSSQSGFYSRSRNASARRRGRSDQEVLSTTSASQMGGNFSRYSP